MAEVYAATVRSPLAEATNRINSSIPTPEHHLHKPQNHRSITSASADHQQKSSSLVQAPATGRVTSAPSHAAAASAPPANASLQPVHVHNDNKRYSQASYASTSSSRSKKSYKTHVGPWQLGRTLGKGSSARVRLCRHLHTGQLAAVKIVNRRMAYLVQDSSLAALSKWDNSLPEQINGEMRVPVAIEREVAILKLIEHPNIMKLYDIWENRSEIYLILEYIDQGDLFTFINSRGRLSEDVAIYFFRQIISAMTYCHSFNICHRDLKPENILITADYQIKIADFGMAALHQTDTHQLATACGSPHYAAPELLKNKQYRGDKADIWSMGVILYAMLSAALPFDDPDLRVMMAKTKKGYYEMPKFLSPEAEDLIHRMLQVNPDRRISLKQIWRHPLVQKYSYLDDLGDNSGQPPDTRKGFQYTPVPKQQIDNQLLRQLRSMWHMFSEHDLAMKLSCEEPNDQKAFYWLLHTYREKQLEDFKPELAHSMSDYHHLKPGAWRKRVSTCQFAQPGPNGRKLFKVMILIVIVVCFGPTIRRRYHTKSPFIRTVESRATDGNHSLLRRVKALNINERGLPPEEPHIVVVHDPREALLRHKRAVDFSHVKKRSNPAKQDQPLTHELKSQQTHSQAECSTQVSKEANYSSNSQTDVEAPPLHLLRKNASVIFHEELRNLSSNVAKSCDEAFKNTLIEDGSIAGSLTDSYKHGDQTPPSSHQMNTQGSKDSGPFVTRTWESRSLPPVPVGRASAVHREQAYTPTQHVVSTVRADNHTNILVDHKLDVDVNPLDFSVQSNRRIVSAPAPQDVARIPVGTLPSINENPYLGMANNDKTRTVSAPPHTAEQKKRYEQNTEYLRTVENTIRVVQSPTALSPVKAPKPLTVRKRTVMEHSGCSNPTVGQERVVSQSSYETIKKKKSSWFKRLSRADTTDEASAGGEDYPEVSADSKEHSSLESNASDTVAKKRSFNFTFWKNNRAKDSRMSIEDLPENEQSSLDGPDTKRGVRSNWRDSGSDGVRNIEVKQNWLARLFRVKPATSYMCMVISRKRARQEIAILFREWRRYGIRGIQVDKNRNIIFARVGAKNFLNLKEVEFAAEVMTVIEHGKRQPLCIVRLTQERGAASSFHKVVETMKAVFASRNLLVTDKGRQRMMIKTLNSSSADGDSKFQ
ncbi:putative serine/threonine-protein kinase HSL1 [Paramyrothecium foliicola]|nr:putative serine/threonine-protein kinase HSL1 [Paramyrothecium foliicola]